MAKLGVLEEGGSHSPCFNEIRHDSPSWSSQYVF